MPKSVKHGYKFPNGWIIQILKVLNDFQKKLCVFDNWVGFKVSRCQIKAEFISKHCISEKCLVSKKPKKKKNGPKT